MGNQNFKLSALMLGGLVFISGCGGLYNNYDSKNIDPMDRSSGLNREDFIKQLTPPPAAPAAPMVQLKEPPLPKMTEALSAPRAPKIKSDKTVTISVTDDVPLKDVFIELSRLADVDIEVDPKIRGGVIFKAKDKPLSEVVERISDMAGLRYSVKNGVIKIEADAPYTENYQASFLNLIRTNSSQVTTSNQSGAKGDGASAENGSKSSIDVKNGGDGDLWVAMEKEIMAIIGSTEAGKGGDSYVSLNRQAGLISVKTTEKNHEKVKSYLEEVKDLYSAQVLIEAKVVEVSLNDQFASGIDWSVIPKDNAGFVKDPANLGAVTIDTPNISLPNFATITLNDGNLLSAVKLAQTFGTTRTLSSPRITTMNNQQALLSFATNKNYFSISCQVTDPELDPTGVRVIKPGKLSVSSTLKTAPIGIILSLQPSINTKTNEITMSVRPTLSRLTGSVNDIDDPAVLICSANAAKLGLDLSVFNSLIQQNKIPQIDVREMDSVLKIKSGEVMVIGGMIDQKDENTDAGVPFASELPIIGNAFKTVQKRTQAVQTVIFLQATIVPGFGVDGKDQEFYNKFQTDPRALEFNK